MKKTFLLAVLLALGTGCASLFPKSVEFGQDKVSKFPEIPAKQTELVRQTAWKAADLAREVHIGVVQEGVSTNIVGKAEDVSLLTESVSDAVGPPKRQPAVDTTARELIASLEHKIALYAANVKDFAEENNVNAGKKIEGTGWLQVPYFLYIGIIAGVVFVGYHVSKVVLAVVSTVHPAAGMGLAAVNLTGSVAGKMIKQLAAGGERFKDAVGNLDLDDKVKSAVLKVFQTEHRGAQDEDTQNVVKELTNKG